MALVCKPFGDIITFTRASTATYFDSTGTLQSAAIDAPRLDYNPSTLAAQGLLIEESRQNLLTYSAQFDNAAWAKTRSSITANATTSPDGTANADKLVEDSTASNTHQTTQGFAKATAAIQYTASLYVKASERTFCVVALTDAGGFVVAGINLSTGAAQINGTSGWTSATVSSQTVSNGWYRFQITATSTADNTVNMIVRTATAINVDNYTGDGTSGIFVFGAQLEAGAFPTSYIPTTTTALTRAADVASVNTLSPWYNSASGTLYVESTTPPGLAGFPNSIGISDGTVNNRMLTYVFTNGFYSGITTGGVSQGNAPVFVTPTVGAASKFAAAYNTNLLQSALNGTAGTPDTTINLPSGLNIMRIGAATLSSNFYNSHIQRITYYPRAFSQTELQTLTT
jgi:hypothetical protein